MATDIKAFVAELRAFEGRREVVKAMRRRITRPVPAVRARIQAYAVAILPSSGGLGPWVAASRISASVRYASARSAGVRLRGSRKSRAGKSDLTRIDAGQVRHPTWGRRSRNAWHTQSVAPGWFTTPATETPQWRDEIDSAVDEAFDKIRGGG